MHLKSKKSHTLTPAGTLNNVDITPAGSIGNKDITPAGTIGTHVLTVAELPAHSHGRGSTQITGKIDSMNLKGDRSTITKSGALSFSSRDNNYGGTSSQDGTVLTYIGFTASNGWSGTSESKGSGTAHGHSWTGTKNTHNHTFTGTKNTHNHTFTGTANTFSIMNPYQVAYCFRRIS